MYSLAANPFQYSVFLYGPSGALFALITAANLLGLTHPRTFRIPSARIRWLLRTVSLLPIVVLTGAFIEHLEKPPPRWELPKTDESVIAAPADGRFIITCANLSKMEFHQYSGPIRVRDSSTGQIQSACLPGERIYDLLLSQNGTHLAVMCANGILKVFNLQKGEVEGEMPYFDTEEGKREVVTRSSSGYWAFSHAGRMLAFAIERNAEDSKGQIVLWDAETRKFTVLCERDVRQILAFSPDGR
jgi:hypothetical protein